MNLAWMVRMARGFIAALPRPSRGPLRPGIADRFAFRLLVGLSARNRILAALGLRKTRRVGWRGALDAPTETSQDVILLRGWAFHHKGAPDRVELFLDGHSLGLARLGLTRPDVAIGDAHTAAARSGFELLVDVSGARTQAASIRIRAVASRLASPDFELSTSLPRTTWPDPPVESATDADVLPGRTIVAPDSRPIRLLAVAHDLSPGGSQIYLAELLVQLRARGVEVAVMAPLDGPLRHRLEIAGASVSTTGSFPFSRLDAYRDMVSRLESQARGSTPDVVLANSLGAFIGVDLALRLQRRVVWAIHEGLALPLYLRAAFGRGLDPQVGARLRELLGRVDLAFFESEASRRLYEPHICPDEAPGVARGPSRAIWLPYGVDLAAIRDLCSRVDQATARERTGLPSGATIVLCAGTVEPRKAQVNLARAFARIVEAHPDAYLVFVGDRPNLYSLTLQDLLAEEPLKHRSRLVPLCDDPALWFRSADVVASVGDVESLPRCLLEAMAFGLPVVATDAVGTAEAVLEGVSGFLCPPNDVDALAQTLDRMLTLKPEARRDMGARGAARASVHHDASRYADAVFERITRLARGSPW
jgi:D-inositol-3-phosphate glycosyltransferase